MASIEIIVRDDQGKILRKVVDDQVVLPELSYCHELFACRIRHF